MTIIRQRQHQSRVSRYRNSASLAKKIWMTSRQTQKMSACSLPKTHHRASQAASLLLVPAAIPAGQLLLQA